MRVTLLTLGLLCCWPADLSARSAAEKGLRTGNGHMVVVTATPSQGLEEGIPRTSAYARGVALDLEMRWDESYKAFREARREFRKQLKRRPRWEKMIRGWIIKAEYQMEQSRRLRYRPVYRYRHYPYVNLSQTVAKHNKWLATRAFTGQSSRQLRDELLAEYKQLIRRNSYNEAPRILLAAFLHELGRHQDGRREFAKVRDQNKTWLAKEVAYYFAAAGKLDQAFKYLEKAVRYRSSDRRYILRSNDFDRLRGDPRFTKLVGEP